MTPREIMLANIEHAGPQRPGCTFHGEGRLMDITGAPNAPSKTYEQKRWTEDDKEYRDDPWGNVWVCLVDGPSSRGEVHRPAIEDWSQLDDLQLPDIDADYRFEPMREKFAQPTDKFKLAGVGGWVFAVARSMRKMEIYFADLIEHREQIDRLHEMIAGLYERVIHKIGQAGADGIFFCEDLGTQDRPLIGPAMWRDIFMPHYKRLTDAAHSYGMKVLQHSCGYNWELLDSLAEAGIDVLQFDQPAAYDMPALAEKLKELKVALWSPLDIQKVMPTGDVELYNAEAKKMMDLFEGFLIFKNYPDPVSLGASWELDAKAYEACMNAAGLDPSRTYE